MAKKTISGKGFQGYKCLHKTVKNVFLASILKSFLLNFLELVAFI